jgi:shikimate O-hydroxycinnamoyltransferase
MLLLLLLSSSPSSSSSSFLQQQKKKKTKTKTKKIETETETREREDMKIERLPPRHVFPFTPSPEPAVVIPLSSSDLAIPRVHVEVVYGFPAAPSAAAEAAAEAAEAGGGGGGGEGLQHRVKLLQDSLSLVLCAYREWAGRLLDGTPSSTIAAEAEAEAEAGAEAGAEERQRRPSIVLNDAGVLFMEARAEGPLSELPAGFKPSQLLLDLVPPSRGSPYLLLVQVKP